MFFDRSITVIFRKQCFFLFPSGHDACIFSYSLQKFFWSITEIYSGGFFQLNIFDAVVVFFIILQQYVILIINSINYCTSQNASLYRNVTKFID